MNKNLQNIYNIIKKKNPLLIDKNIINLIIEEIDSSPENIDQDLLLNIKKIVDNTEYNNYLINKFPENFLDDKKNIIQQMHNTSNSIKKDLLEVIIKKYKDNLSQDDFINILSFINKDENLLKTVWQNLLKLDYFEDSNFIQYIDEKGYLFNNISSSVLTDIFIDTNNKKIHDKRVTFYNNFLSKKEEVDYLTLFIMYQIESYLFHNDLVSKNNLEKIKEHFKQIEPDFFNNIVVSVLLSQKKGISLIKKRQNNLKKLLIGNTNKIKIKGKPFSYFEFYINPLLEKKMSENNFKKFLLENSFEDLLPFSLNYQKNDSIYFLLKNFEIKENILKTIVDFEKNNIELSSYLYRDSIDYYFGGALRRIIKNIARHKENIEINYNKFIYNKEYISKIFLYNSNIEDFNNNLRILKNEELKSEFILFSIINDIRLENDILSSFILNYQKKHFDYSFFRNLDYNMEEFISNNLDKIDYNKFKEYNWDYNNLTERNFCLDFEKYYLSKNLSKEFSNKNKRRI